MNISNIHEVKKGFQVLHTTMQSQTAVMILAAGKKSSEEMNTHEKSDQVLLLLEGELHGYVNDEKRILKKGDVCVVPAGTPHRFENQGNRQAVTFNVYSPPEYAADEKD